MKTLLAAVDLSPITQKVLEGAATLASNLGARLLILHVAEPVAAYVPVGAAMDVITAPVPLEPPDPKEIQAYLEKLAAPLRTRGVPVETAVALSSAVDEILKQSSDTGACMLVLGSHGHGALHHLFSGSVVTSVLRKATLPVTIIPVHER